MEGINRVTSISNSVEKVSVTRVRDVSIQSSIVVERFGMISKKKIMKKGTHTTSSKID